jgi:hypothetical protein
MPFLLKNITTGSTCHGIEEQIGGQLAAGFRLTNVFDDMDTGGADIVTTPGYWATRAVKNNAFCVTLGTA